MKIFIILFLLLFPTVIFATPSTPTNAPLVHPLAPNPHTSMGLFWTYLDANTGRSWNLGTFKVKRCTGAGCTPTTVIATGLTNPDYQDFGLSSNTTYCYSYLANDGADSGNSPTTCKTTEAVDTNFVIFPDTKWSKILGTLVESSQIPYSYYTDSMTSQGADVISKFPVVAPSAILGTGSITNGSNILTGVGTKFLEQIAANNPACLDAISLGGINLGAIASVDSNTQITLVSNATSTQSGAVISTNISGLCGFADPLNDYIVANQLGYYDSSYALWQIYFMTGDPQYMRGARKDSEAVFAGYMWLGRNRAWNQFSTTPNTDNMPAPRNFQFTGYLLLGLAGNNGVWDLLDDYLVNRYATFVSNYRGGDNNFLFIREKGYTILFANQFVEVAPDSFPRSDGTTTSINGTTTVNGDLSTGRKSFYKTQLDTDIPGFILDDQTAAGEWYEENQGGSNADNHEKYPPGSEQPWISGLVMDALGNCWNNPDLASATRDAARKEVLRAVAMMALRGYNSNVAADDPTKRWNYIWYFMGGGTRLNPYAFEYGSDAAILNNTPDNNMMAQYRQGNPFMLAPLAWAYLMSGDSIYKTWGEAAANAVFASVGENVGGTGDGVKGLCDADANYKDFGQCFRTSAKFFGARLMSPSSLGTAPTVTMPSNQTLTNGVNQASLTASVTCTNNPCTYKWYMVEYPLNIPRWTPHAVFSADGSLTTLLSGMENGTYKIGFYALDNLGLVGTGTTTITVGDGVFPPVVVMHISGGGATCVTGTSVSGINVNAASRAGRSLTHTFSIVSPKDASAPTITPSGTTGTFITVSVSGLTATSSSFYTLIDSVSDGVGRPTVAYFVITKHSTCGNFSQPSSGHNTIPSVNVLPNYILEAGSTSTKFYFTPVDPEGSVRFVGSAIGYGQNMDGDWVVNALTNSFVQIGGPVTATITNGTTLQPEISGMTQSGVYTFQYSGTDAQGDAVTATRTVTILSSSTKKCNWDSTCL